MKNVLTLTSLKYLVKKHETLAKNPPIKIYPNKIKNRINKDKDGEDVPKLESVEVVSMH